MSKKNIFSKILVGGGVVALALGFQFIYAWTSPTQSPPSGNTSAPVNIGTTDQVKNGELSVNAFSAFGNAYVQGTLGVGVVSPVTKLEVDGSLRIGNGGETCASGVAGSVRYNSSSKKIEFCNGTSWITPEASWSDVTSSNSNFNTSCDYKSVRDSDGVTVYPTTVSATYMITEYSGAGSQMNSTNKTTWTTGNWNGGAWHTYERC